MEKLKSMLLKPFEDWKKLSIGATLMMVPFVNIITGVFVYGYLLTYCHNSLKSKAKLPEWKDFGELLKRGITGVAANLLLAIPAIILLVLLILSIGYKLNPDCVLNNCEQMVRFNAPIALVYSLLVLCVLVTILAAYFSPYVQMRFSKTYKIRDAFCMDMFSIVFSGKYLITFLQAAGIMVMTSFVAWIAAELLGFTYVLPFVIIAYMEMINQIIYFTLFTERFRKGI